MKPNPRSTEIKDSIVFFDLLGIINNSSFSATELSKKLNKTRIAILYQLHRLEEEGYLEREELVKLKCKKCDWDVEGSIKKQDIKTVKCKCGSFGLSEIKYNKRGNEQIFYINKEKIADDISCYLDEIGVKGSQIDDKIVKDLIFLMKELTNKKYTMRGLIRSYFNSNTVVNEIQKKIMKKVLRRDPLSIALKKLGRMN